MGYGWSFKDGDWERLRQIIQKIASINLGPESVPTFGGVSVNYIDFDTTYEDGAQEGRLQWNIDDGTLEVGMPGGDVNLQIGQENLVRVTNDNGTLIENGSAVYVSGATGANIKVKKPIASNTTTAPLTFGIATEDIAVGQKGYVTIIGNVRDFNTLNPGGESWSAGEPVWLSPTTAGALTNVRPSAPNIAVAMGVVVKAHATEGIVACNPVVVQRISLSSDALVTTPTSDNSFLQWDNANGYWEDRTSITVPGTITTPITNTQVLFSDSGVIAGDAGMTYNKTTDSLTLIGDITCDELTVGGDITWTGFSTADLSDSSKVVLLANALESLALRDATNTYYAVIVESGSNGSGFFQVGDFGVDPNDFPAIFHSWTTIYGDLAAEQDVYITGDLTVGSGNIRTIKTVTGTYTVTTSDYTVLGNHATAAFTITLPATATTGQIFNIKNINNAYVTVAPGAGDKLDGVVDGTVVLSKGESITVQSSSGTEWWII
jgi:hypothetical protein